MANEKKRKQQNKNVLHDNQLIHLHVKSAFAPRKIVYSIR